MTTEEFARMVAGLNPSDSNPASDLAGDAIASLDSLIGMAREARTQDPGTMPAAVHGEAVMSAFRHLPLLGRLDYTYTVITRDDDCPPDSPRYSVSRTRFAPLLGRWSVDTDYPVSSGMTWTDAAMDFAHRVTIRAS